MFLCVFCAALVEFTEADEALADQALLGDVFLFMKEGILGCESFGQEEFYIRRLHSLITDFLALMPMKVRGAIVVHNYFSNSLVCLYIIICYHIVLSFYQLIRLLNEHILSF